MRWTTSMWNFRTECQRTHRGVMDNKADISENDSMLFEKKSVSELKALFSTFSLFYFSQNVSRRA